MVLNQSIRLFKRRKKSIKKSDNKYEGHMSMVIKLAYSRYPAEATYSTLCNG